MELVHAACCGKQWVGADRAHCCARASYLGCGEVFDDAELFDAHRLAGECADPGGLTSCRPRTGSGSGRWICARFLTPLPRLASEPIDHAARRLAEDSPPV